MYLNCACLEAKLVFAFLIAMRRIRISLGFGRTATATIAAVAVALVLVLGAFAASPSLHQLVHADTGRPDGLCVVCAFASGHVIGPAAVSLIGIACILLIDAIFLPEAPLISHLNFYFSPNRAPPRLPLFN
jgi:hypothetical protein